MIKAILLDVGGTLIKVTPSVGHVYSYVAGRHGLTIDPEKLNHRFTQAWKRHRHLQKIQDINWWHDIVSDVFSPYKFRDKDTFFADLYAMFINASAWNVFPDVAPFFQQAADRNIPLYVASNWDDRLPQLLKNLDLHRHFTRLFVSYDMKVAKPDPEFFRRILTELKLKPHEVVHVGDEEENDCLAPQRAGLQALIIRSNNESLERVWARLDFN